MSIARPYARIRFVMLMLAAVVASACEQAVAPDGSARPIPGDSTPVVQPPSPTAPPRKASRFLMIGYSAMRMAPRGEESDFPPTVQVLDERGQSLPDIPVDFAVIEGAGTLAVERTHSNQSGIAHAEKWTLGRAVGRNVVRATSPKIADTVYFEMAGVDVDSTLGNGDFRLERLDELPLAEYNARDSIEVAYQSVTLALRANRFVLTWTSRGKGVSTWEQSGRIEGSVESRGARLRLTTNSSGTNEYFNWVDALVLKGGQLRLVNYSDTWPIYVGLQEFAHVPTRPSP